MQKPLNLREEDYPLYIQRHNGCWHLCGTLSAGKYFDIAAAYDLSIIRELLAISAADLNRVINLNPNLTLEAKS